MALNVNDQLEENAVDLRNVQTDIQPPQANAPVAPVVSSSIRSVSLTKIVLAIAIMIGFVIIVYLFLQKQSIRSGQGPSPTPLTPIKPSR